MANRITVGYLVSNAEWFGTQLMWCGRIAAGRRSPSDTVLVSILASRCGLGLAGRAHQARWNIELPGWPKSPGRRGSLTSQVPKCLAAEIDTMRVMGAASEDCLSSFHHQASNSHAHMKERAAVRLNQRPFLTFLPFHE